MLMTVLIVVIVLIAAVLAYAATRPDTMHVERSLTINASPETIFPFLNDFHNWIVWSPWEKLDPNLKRTYSGSHSGKGAAYAWEGNKKAGAGRMEITDSASPARVAIQLDFIKPFEGHNVTQFQLVPSGTSSTVRWTMDGPNPFMAKVMCIFINMDKMIGKDFDAGLANLKAAAER